MCCLSLVSSQCLNVLGGHDAADNCRVEITGARCARQGNQLKLDSNVKRTMVTLFYGC